VVYLEIAVRILRRVKARWQKTSVVLRGIACQFLVSNVPKMIFSMQTPLLVFYDIFFWMPSQNLPADLKEVLKIGNNNGIS
jgi:hypothetical protein